MKIEETAFREAMIDWLDRTGVGATELSRRSGVSKAQIDKLRQRRAVSTNVEDAIRISACFGQSLETFVGLNRDPNSRDSLMVRIARLNPTQMAMLDALLHGLLASK